MTRTGLDRIAAEPPPFLAGAKAVLLCNQASVSARFVHARDIVARSAELVAILSPQHGFFSEKQDNMIESGHFTGPDGIPVFSLYGETRRPTAEMLSGADTLVVDLQDVGVRVYTFISTVVHCLEEAAGAGIRVVVLDRPNPVSGAVVEGNVLDPGLRSFVGIFPMPMRHGMTMGELAMMINREAGINAELEVVAMGGWDRSMFFADTGLPWTFPSPNMPSPLTALVYPGQVVWEGTNVSEGRGTALPFELFGAPFFPPGEILGAVPPEALAGCVLREIVFEPVSNKWAGESCRGFHIHVTDPARFRPYRLTLAMLAAVARICPEFGLKPPPYEYEFEKRPLDLIIGDRGIADRVLEGGNVLALEGEWRAGLDDFMKMRKQYLLYR